MQTDDSAIAGNDRFTKFEDHIFKKIDSDPANRFLNGAVVIGSFVE